MHVKSRRWAAGLLLWLAFTGCRTLKQDIMFKTETPVNMEAFERAYETVTKNYHIEPMDYIAVTVYTNKGEMLIDPNNEFELGDQGSRMQQGGAGNMLMQQQMMGIGERFNTSINRPIMQNMQQPRSFMVNEHGMANLPQVGAVKLAGLTLSQADSLLASAYAEFYETPFVLTQYLNKRVVLMGALGDKVVPLQEENMSLVELLAFAGDFQIKAKGNKIRVIRGIKDGGENISVQLVDLSTIEGVRAANMQLLPGDVVYVEPRRRIDRESLSDTGALVNVFSSPVLAATSIVSTIVSIVLLVQTLNSK